MATDLEIILTGLREHEKAPEGFWYTPRFSCELTKKATERFATLFGVKPSLIPFLGVSRGPSMTEYGIADILVKKDLIPKGIKPLDAARELIRGHNNPGYIGEFYSFRREQSDSRDKKRTFYLSYEPYD